MMWLFAFVAPIVWIAAWIGGSIIYRRKTGKPLIPRAPENAVFAEAWRSGRSLKNVLTRIGGASNCLLVYLADGKLTIVPVFPFNLMFLPDIYGLEVTAPISKIAATRADGLFGKRIILSFDGSARQDFELRLQDPEGFLGALECKRATPIKSAPSKRSRGSGASLRLQLVLIAWGLFAGCFGLLGLKEDIRFRTHGAVTTGRIVGHTQNENGVLQYEVDDRPYTLISIRGSGLYKIGDVENVRYMPGQPESARENDYLGFDLLFVCLGLFVLALGSALAWIRQAFSRLMNL